MKSNGAACFRFVGECRGVEMLHRVTEGKQLKTCFFVYL